VLTFQASKAVPVARLRATRSAVLLLGADRRRSAAGMFLSPPSLRQPFDQRQCPELYGLAMC
jgi:hypothetical protein